VFELFLPKFKFTALSISLWSRATHTSNKLCLRSFTS